MNSPVVSTYSILGVYQVDRRVCKYMSTERAGENNQDCSKNPQPETSDGVLRTPDFDDSLGFEIELNAFVPPRQVGTYSVSIVNRGRALPFISNGMETEQLS